MLCYVGGKRCTSKHFGSTTQLKHKMGIFGMSIEMTLNTSYRNSSHLFIPIRFAALITCALLLMTDGRAMRCDRHLLIEPYPSLAPWASLLQSQLQQLVKHYLPVRWILPLPPFHHHVNHHKKERQATALRQRHRRRKCAIDTISCSCLHKQYCCYK